MEQRQKRVTFKEKVQVFEMYTWKYAYREARKSIWLNVYIDRMRFKRRIKLTEEILNPILREKLLNINKINI